MATIYCSHCNRLIDTLEEPNHFKVQDTSFLCTQEETQTIITEAAILDAKIQNQFMDSDLHDEFMQNFPGAGKSLIVDEFGDEGARGHFTKQEPTAAQRFGFEVEE